MRKNKKEKIKRWMVAIVVLFMVLMLILAYMPMIFAPKQPPREREEDDKSQEIIEKNTGTSTQTIN